MRSRPALKMVRGPRTQKLTSLAPFLANLRTAANPTSDRHCVNSVSIRYNPDKQAKWEKYSKDAAK